MKIIPFFGLLLPFSKAHSRGKKIRNAAADTGERYLIVTADDYGASRNINEGIELAASHNIITSIAALTNFRESLAGLKSITQKNPGIGIGVHLNNTTGTPLTNPELIQSLVNKDGNFHTLETLLPVIKHVSAGELKIELRAQIQALLDIGIPVDHLSDHNGILSLYPPFFKVLCELAQEYKLPVRSPAIAGMKYPEVFPGSPAGKQGVKVFRSFFRSNPGRALSVIADFRLLRTKEKAGLFDRAGIAYPDLFIEYFYGNPTTSNLDYILNHLPPGINELVLHLGTGTRQQDYPGGLDLAYFENRELELATVTRFGLNAHLQKLQIRKIGFSDLAGLRHH